MIRLKDLLLLLDSPDYLDKDKCPFCGAKGEDVRFVRYRYYDYSRAANVEKITYECGSCFERVAKDFEIQVKFDGRVSKSEAVYIIKHYLDNKLKALELRRAEYDRISWYRSPEAT